MARDRYLHTLLTVIAVLLLLNLFKGSDKPLATLESKAHAQSDGRIVQVAATPVLRQASNLRVAAIGGNQVTGLKDMIPLGDGKTFVVSNTSGFLVYQVEPINPRSNN